MYVASAACFVWDTKPNLPTIKRIKEWETKLNKTNMLKQNQNKTKKKKVFGQVHAHA